MTTSADQSRTTTKMRCDQCVHWRLAGTHDWTAEGIGFGECLGVRERWTIQDEAGREAIENDYPEYENEAEETLWEDARRSALLAARAYVQDGSEYRAELFTAPDFFCALFTPSPPPQR